MPVEALHPEDPAAEQEEIREVVEHVTITPLGQIHVVLTPRQSDYLAAQDATLVLTAVSNTGIDSWIFVEDHKKMAEDEEYVGTWVDAEGEERGGGPFSELSVKELKEKLRGHRTLRTGAKPELLARLQAAEAGKPVPRAAGTT
jgi:hypothetical protein